MKINFYLPVLCIILSSCFLTAADDNKPIRIMPLGDSITAGYTDNAAWHHPFEFGYRSGLYKLLKKAEVNFVFVGKSPEPFNNFSGDPSHGGTVSPSLDLRTLGMDGHRGYGGWGINPLQQNIAQWIAEDKPDIILLMCGINGTNKQSPAQLEALVQTAFTADKEVKIIVAQITPMKNFNPLLIAFNKYIIDTLVPKYKDKGFAISTVNMYPHFLTDPNDFKSIDVNRLSNKINHPTNELYDKMAATWFEGVQEILD